jgi:hypothetical protein
MNVLSVLFSVLVVPAGATINADSLIASEFQTARSGDEATRIEFGQGAKDVSRTPVEAFGRVGSGTPSLIEFPYLTNGTGITIAAAPALEWADPPARLIVSPERLLRSSGKVRILAGPGSVHPLRGQ